MRGAHVEYGSTSDLNSCALGKVSGTALNYLLSCPILFTQFEPYCACGTSTIGALYVSKSLKRPPIIEVVFCIFE